MAEKVGWIGLGNIGAPMAMRLVEHPGGLVVCDVVPEATEPFAAAGAEVAADAAGVLAAGATVISLMVRDDAQVRDVVGQIVTRVGERSGRAATGGPSTGGSTDVVVAIHSTIGPDTAAELTVAAEPAGVQIVDAPVSGGAMGAASGRLAVLAGGEATAVDRCRDAFGYFADLVVHFGPTGAGTRAKVIRNLITFTSYAATGEASRLAEACGLDLLRLGEVVRHSDAVTAGPGAVMLRGDASPMAADDGLRPPFEHTRYLGEKDLDLAMALAADLGIDTPLAALAREHLAAALGVPHEPGAPEPA